MPLPSLLPAFGALLQLVLLLMMPSASISCGGFFCSFNQPVVQAGESIVFGVDGRNISMHVQINYQGPSEDFGWILPVMYDPTLSVDSSEVMFQRLFNETRPRFSFSSNFDKSTTCDFETIDNGFCPPIAFSPGGGATGDDSLVEEIGSVGPFDFVILKPSNVSELSNWLQENNYDEYTESDEILEQYIDQYFIALRLNKQSDDGDLVPIVISYEIPEDADMDALTCIPLVLTSLSTTSSLPIQVHLLGKGQADPVNFFRVELDDHEVDWLGCGQPAQIGFPVGFSNPDSCFDRDYRRRAAEAFELVDDHAFVVEYAGNTEVMQGKIGLSLDMDMLSAATTPSAFLLELANRNVPTFLFLDAILDDYIPNVYDEAAPFFCQFRTSIYTPSNTAQMSMCADALTTKTIDAQALAAEIELKVAIPSVGAEVFVQSYDYLTSLYVSMRQEVMNKDPVFTIRSAADSVDVSNQHTAEGVPSCNEKNTVEELTITVGDGSSESFPAVFECGVFRRSMPQEERSPAQQLVVSAFGEDAMEVVLERDNEGSFDTGAIARSVELMDTRVALLMQQPNVTANSTASPTPTPPPVMVVPEKKVVPLDSIKDDRFEGTSKIFNDQGEKRGDLTRRKLRGA